MFRLDINSDTVVEWSNFTDKTTGQSITDATINGALKTLDLSTLGSFSLSYSTGLSKYVGTIGSTIASTTSLVEGQEYYIDLTATKSGNTGFRRLRAIAKYRGST